jgi:solute:Na+ symporter, SSS family
MVGNDVVRFLVQGMPILEAMADTQAINLMSFVFIFIVSLTGCVAGCLLTPSVDEATTDAFYRKTKPWGFWKPVIQKINQSDLCFVPNLNFKSDATNVLIGIAWQMSMVVMPVFAGFRQWQSLGISLFVFVVTTGLLKRLWYDRLEEIE